MHFLPSPDLRCTGFEGVLRIALLLAVFLLQSPLAASAEEGSTATPAKGSPPEPPASSTANPTAEKTAPAEHANPAEVLAPKVRASVVVISVAGRDGRRQGLGTGFVISEDGLIATNLHVLGEARPIAVEMADGTKHDVVEVYASDRTLDLAVIRVSAEKLPALPLGDSEQVRQGQEVVVVGNPHGLKHSVVRGVVSGKREVDRREMLQLAIPIEPGNSGGPVLDRAGRVQGIVTMKSAVTENLGFAAPVNQLKPLLERPNPVPMSRWLTIGALDDSRWKPLFGARWQQRAGRIRVEQPGAGFGGRSLCLWQKDVPELPFELAVWVKLDDEAGAAGLVFHSDGRQRHYGFYPSAGKLRLTRFAGSSVYSWTVLHNQPSEHYKPGDWNHLKVRLEPEKILCYVNDELVVASTDNELAPGSVGLAKFRDTLAEFKRFRVAESIPSSKPDPELVAKLNREVEKLSSLEDVVPRQLDSLTEHPAAADAVLRAEAQRLEQRAEAMRRLATDVHVRTTCRQLADVVRGDEDEQIDLALAALLIAKLDEKDLDPRQYLRYLDRMAEEIRSKLPEGADERQASAALNEYLFRDNGFHGSRTDYYHPANSHLSRVIDDREGLPITLSVLYLELAHRIDLEMEGVGLPGHFVVRWIPAEGDPQLVDVFDRGKLMSRKDAEKKVLQILGEPLREEHLQAATKREIVLRMLNNLLGIAERKGDMEGVLRYLEAKLVVDPESIGDRGKRAIARFQTGRRQAAIEDLDWFLENEPDGLDLNRIEQMRDYFLRRQP